MHHVALCSSRRTRTAALAVLIAAACAIAGCSEPRRGSDGRYGDGPQERYRLTMPADDGPAPLALFIHGGSWLVGGRQDVKGVVPADQLVAKGWAVASIDYTLTPDAPHPAQIADVRRAIRYFRDNGDDLGLDADTILLIGFSAGGHLALLAGATTAGVDGVVAMAPVTDIPAFAQRSPAEVAMLLGCPSTEPLCDADALAELDPIAALDEDDPPVYLLVGDIDDLTVPAEQAIPYVAAARSVLGNDAVWFDQLPGVGHSDIPQHSARVVEFARWVRARSSQSA